MDPPETDRREVTETLHGVTITDPYRWLEADPAEDDDVADWIEAQNAYADDLLDLPVRERLADRFEDLARTDDYGPVDPVGGRYVQQFRLAEMEQPVIAVREGPDDEPRILVNPNEWGEDATDAVDWYVPDEDGERLAYGVNPGGTENLDVHVIDVETGEELDRLEGTGRTHSLAWTEEGFYYVRTGTADAAEGGQLEKSVRYHHLGTDPDEDRIVLEGIEETTWPGVTTEDDVLIVTLSQGWDRSEVYGLEAAEPRSDPLELVPVVTDREETFSPALDGEAIYLLTDHDAPRSRLLRTSVERALADDEPLDPAALEVVLPEREGVLRGVAPLGDRLVAHYHVDAVSRLSVFDTDGDHRRDLELPAYASVGGFSVDEDGSELSYAVTGFDVPGEVWLVDLEADDRRCLDRKDVGFDASLSIDQAWFESADGTEVPAFVVHREGIDRDGENPTYLTGYGGFRVNRTPAFDRFAIPFLEAGGIYVLATLRGGNEYGEPWHEAGRRENKRRVFEDFLAVAEGLIDRGYTTPDRLGIAGGSNGGLLVGAAMTSRPDLFGAVHCAVPLLDMLRFHRFLLGASWTTEYGNPDDEDDFEYLHAYSPYHNVEPAAYPPTLFTTAAGDTRVHPSHARKMAARLQERSTGGAPILCRTRTDTGHGTGKSTSMLVEEQAEQWAFLFEHLGVE